jgi:hypothetical protein
VSRNRASQVAKSSSIATRTISLRSPEAGRGRYPVRWAEPDAGKGGAGAGRRRRAGGGRAGGPQDGSTPQVGFPTGNPDGGPGRARPRAIWAPAPRTRGAAPPRGAGIVPVGERHAVGRLVRVAVEGLDEGPEVARIGGEGDRPERPWRHACQSSCNEPCQGACNATPRTSSGEALSRGTACRRPGVANGRGLQIGRGSRRLGRDAALPALLFLNGLKEALGERLAK